MNRSSYLFDKSLIFKQIPLFSKLNFFKRKLVFDALEIFEYKRSEVIYREGDPPDAFYCIVTGRVEIFTEKDGCECTLEYIHRGKFFGFISLLTGEPHSVSARAVNDTVIAKISKEDFDTILKNIPSLAINLSQMLSRRLKRKDLHPKLVFESTIIAVYGDVPIQHDTARYALNLALGLKNETNKRVILVDTANQDSLICSSLGLNPDEGFKASGQFFHTEEVMRHIVKDAKGIDVFRVKPERKDESLAPFLISLLTMLVNDYHYCIVHLALDFGEQAFRVLAQSDDVHLLFSPEKNSLKKMSQTMQAAGVWADAELKKKVKFIVLEESGLHGKGPRLSCEQEAALFHKPLFATMPYVEQKFFLIDSDPNAPYSKTIRRISRQIGEVLVGLALGSGSAMGLSHIGVLKVLEDNKIPIDIISGSSIGALIGAFWSLGYSAYDIEQIILLHKNKRYFFGLDDLALPVKGLIHGRHIYSFLKKYLKNLTFRDVVRPFKIVACDCTNMRQVVFDSGRLIDAVMASISIPGVFEPYRIANHIYIDGGILNPLPTDVLVESGVKKVIAVNVLPSPVDIERTYELADQKIAENSKMFLLNRAREALNKKVSSFLRPNIFDIIVSSVQSMEFLLARLSSLSQADVTLHPDMTSVSWYEFENAKDLIVRGEEEALLHLAEIKELLV